MTVSRLIRIAALPLLLLAAMALIWLAFLLLREAIAIGAAEAAMVAITLLFVVVLPLAMPVLSLAARHAPRPSVPRIVPIAGGKVP